MTFDKVEHKQIVLELIKQASFPGAILEQILELKSAVVGGVV